MNSTLSRSLQKCFISLFAFSSLLVLPISVSALGQQDGADHNQKVSLYHQTLSDPLIVDLMNRVDRDPQNVALMNELLFRLPQSPLEMFEISMSLRHVEMAVPKYLHELHLRWLNFHPEAIPFKQLQETVAAELMPALSAPMPLSAVVGTNVDEAYTLSSPNGGPLEYQGEIQLFVNKNNTSQMVDAANTWNACGTNANGTQDVFASTDGGATWNYNCTPDLSSFGLSCARAHFGSDPAIAWDNSGNAYINYMLICCTNITCTTTGNSMVVAKSTDAGSTWTALGKLSPSPGSDDKNMYVIDNTPTSPYYNRHYSCWDVGNNERVARSTNQGTNWTIVDTPSGSKTVDIGCDLAISDGGTVYLNWDGLSGCNPCSAEDTYFTRSTDGGVTWVSPVKTIVSGKSMVSFSSQTDPPAANSRGLNPFANIDIDNNSASACYHTLYASYTDMASGTDQSTANIYVKRSTDNGDTWSARILVNDDGGTGTQFHPWLAVDQTDGSVIVGWHDTRNDANKKKVDYYMSRSTDCGLTWESNIKVSAASNQFNNNSISYTDENSTDNPNANGNNFGEYLGVDAHNRKTYMAWADTRQFYPNNTTNTQKENLGHASITFCSAPTSLGAPTVTPQAGCNGAYASVDLSWSAPAAWGTSATGGTYSVQRATSLAGTYSTLVSGLSSTSYTDTTALGGTTYYYRIVATNNCPGTSLTPMSLNSSSASGTANACPNVAFSAYGGVTQVCGDGDSVIEPGEKWSVSVTLANSGGVTANSTQATLSVNGSSSVTATISGNPGSYGAISASGTASASYTFEVDSGAACVNSLTFDVTSISSTEGSYSSATSAFAVQVGQSDTENATQAASPLDATNSSTTSNFTPAFTLPSATSGTVSYTLSYSNPITTQTANQVTSPITAQNNTVTSALSPAFTFLGANATSATVTWTLGGTTSLTNCAEVRLRAPDASESTLKAFGSANTGSANVLAFYQSKGAGTYTIVLQEQTSCGTSSKTATISNTQMAVQGSTSSGNATNNARVELLDGSSAATILKDYGAANASPYNIVLSYTGSGTYKIRVSENNGGGTARVTGGTMSVTRLLCDVVSCNAPPGEVTGGSWSGTKDTWSWSTEANSTSYRVYRGAPSDLPGLLDSTIDSCKRYEGAALNTSNILTETPAAGSFYWYVVVGVNSAGEGSAGNATSGARVINSSGTCP